MPTRIEGNKFANPGKKSLEQLTFQIIGEEDGVIRNMPALHTHWTTRTDFGNYISLMSSMGRYKTGVELEEWQYEAEHCRENLEYLLNCRHHEFWSYMVFQKNALSSIVTFLQRATPFYLDLWSQVSDARVIDLYEEILSLVLRIVCRLITNKESSDAWIAKEQQCELIYKNFLISVPMLFDLLVALGDADAQNAAMLRKIFNTLLQIEPNYKQDLLAALSFFRAAFRSIQTQAENEGFEGAGGGAAEESAETPYDDVALYALDCAYSLSVLLDVCPEVRALCAEIKLGQSIAHFYDSTIPFLYKNIFLVNENATSLAWLNQARLQYLRAFRSIAYCYVETVLMKPEESLAPSENYVGLLTECLSEQIFVIDYQRGYPVEMDMEILRQACKDLDDFKATFVVHGYQKEAESVAFGTIGNIALTLREQEEKTNARELDTTLVSQRDAVMQVNGTATGVDHTAARDIDLDVTAVLDVLPHLGTGFVRHVLSRYENSEDAIAAILEENLPPDLVNADQKEVHIPLDPQDKLYQQTGIKHYNVFDGDAYDVMTQDDPNCIIKRGKGFPHAPQNAAQLLDDKRDLEKIRHRYQEYSLVTEGDDENDEYEDEYDDSYEALLESETRVIKSKELKAGLANVDDVSDTESDEETETQTIGNNRRNNNDFCENPENVRARYEAQRQAKWGPRSGGGGSGGAGVEKGVPNRNVIGAPRGQGQDKDTLRNRDKKEKNKSSRANHNRKAGAVFKRSRGMMG